MSSRILVAMDRFTTLDKALRFAEPIAEKVAGFKVHSLLDRHGAETVVPAFRELGGKVMADMKIKDIPATGADRASVYFDAGADFLTVHASGGVPMMQEAVKMGGDKTMILAISVLTSMSKEQAFATYGAAIPEKVLLFAQWAVEAGCYGLVCSTEELEMLAGHEELRGLKRVVPGIRLEDSSKDDQDRIGTPDGAAEAGADFEVIGRLITKADDPVAMVDKLNALIASVL